MSLAAPLDNKPFSKLLQFAIIGRDKIKAAYERDCDSPAIKQAIADFYAGHADYPAGETSPCYRELRVNSQFMKLFNNAKNEANRAGLLAIYYPKLERLKVAFDGYCDLLYNNFQNLNAPDPDEDEQQKDWTESFLELNAAIVDLMDAAPTQSSDIRESAAANEYEQPDKAAAQANEAYRNDPFRGAATSDGLRAIIAELRGKWPDYTKPFPEPQAHLRELWTGLRSIGLKPGTIPYTIKPSGNYGYNHNNTQESVAAWEQFHAALDQAEQLIDAAYPPQAQDSTPEADEYEQAVKVAEEELDQAERRLANATANANAILQLSGIPDATYIDKSGRRDPNASLPEPWKYVEELTGPPLEAYCEFINANSAIEPAKEKLKEARQALANRIVTLGDFVGCVRANEVLAQRAMEQYQRGGNMIESRFLTRAPKFHYTQHEADQAASRYRASPYCAVLETMVLAAGKPWKAESIKQLAAQAATTRGETLDQLLALEIVAAVAILQGKPNGMNSPTVDADASEKKLHAPDDKQDTSSQSITGYLGGDDLTRVLGVHPTRSEAFNVQLSRQRLKLGDNCWHEVSNPRPNCPRYLYRVDSPDLKELAKKYQTPKRN